MGLSGWRVPVAVVAAALVLMALAVALVWLAVLVAVVLGLLGLHLYYLPRWSAQLRVPPVALGAALLPVLVLAGWALGHGPSGAALGALAWVAAVALPQLGLLYLLRRGLQLTVLRSTSGGVARREALEARACSTCGLVSVPEDADEPCPSCGARAVQTTRLLR